MRVDTSITEFRQKRGENVGVITEGVARYGSWPDKFRDRIMTQQQVVLVPLVEHEQHEVNPVAVGKEVLVPDAIKSEIRTCFHDGTDIGAGITFEPDVPDDDPAGINAFAYQESRLFWPEPISSMGNDRRSSSTLSARRCAKDKRLALGHATFACSNLDGASSDACAAHPLSELASE
jgi:hypothetical protein